MKQYQTVIFDLDGTLTDSASGILNAVAYSLNKMGCPLPDEKTLRRFLGPPLAESYIKYCGMDEEAAAATTAWYREHYVDREGWKDNAVFPFIRPLLRRLKDMGCHLAVATGKPENTARPILEYFGLMPFFDMLSCPDLSDFHCDKAVMISRVLGRFPGTALMVGDIPGDLSGARRCGIDSCAALWGYGEREEMLRENPTLAPETPEELCLTLTGSTVTPGFFITLEGVDGCGKTTQQKLLKKRLENFGYRVTLSREPGGCPLAEDIRKILLAKEDNGMQPETEALLFAAARCQHIHDTILPAIGEGRIVICDRYVDSSVVYQGAGRGLGVDFVKAINRAAYTAGLPDMTILLRMDPAQALRRRGDATPMDRIEKSGHDFFASNARAYDDLAQREGRFVPVDASREPEAIGDEIFAQVLSRLKEAGL